MKQFYKFLIVALVFFAFVSCKSTERTAKTENAAPISFTVMGAGINVVFTRVSDVQIDVTVPDGVTAKALDSFMSVVAQNASVYSKYALKTVSENNYSLLFSRGNSVTDFSYLEKMINTFLKTDFVNIFAASVSGVEFNDSMTVMDFDTYYIIVTRLSGTEISMFYPKDLLSTQKVKTMAWFMSSVEPEVFQEADLLILKEGTVILSFKTQITDPFIDDVASLIKFYYY